MSFLLAVSHSFFTTKALLSIPPVCINQLKNQFKRITHNTLDPIEVKQSSLTVEKAVSI